MAHIVSIGMSINDNDANLIRARTLNSRLIIC